MLIVIPLRIYLATVFVIYGGVQIVWTLMESGLFQVQNWEVELYNVSHNIDIKVPLTLSILFLHLNKYPSFTDQRKNYWN